MSKYEIKGQGKIRMLFVEANHQHLHFFEYEKNKQVPIKLEEKEEGIFYAVVSEEVLVFRDPHPTLFHNEVMRLNARAYWLGGKKAKRPNQEKFPHVNSYVIVDEQRIRQDMLEFVEKI